jgi:hypothetical protein
VSPHIDDVFLERFEKERKEELDLIIKFAELECKEPDEWTDDDQKEWERLSEILVDDVPVFDNTEFWLRMVGNNWSGYESDKLRYTTQKIKQKFGWF